MVGYYSSAMLRKLNVHKNTKRLSATTFVPVAKRPRPNARYNLRPVRVFESSGHFCNSDDELEHSDDSDSSDAAIVRRQKKVLKSTKCKVRRSLQEFDGTILRTIFSFFDATQAAVVSKVCRAARLYGPLGVSQFVCTAGFRKQQSGKFIQYLEPFKFLRQLCLSSSAAFGDEDAICLSTMPFCATLLSLELSSTMVTSVGMSALARQCKSLVKIRISYLQNVQSDSIALLAHNCNDLSWIDLSASGVGDEGILAIASNCTNAVFLDCSWCSAGDVSLRAIAYNMTNLKSLRTPAQGTDEGLDAVSLRLTQLTSIGIVRMDVSDDAFVRLGQRLHNLSSLHIAGARMISDRGLQDFADRNTRLKNFNFRTPGILATDRGLSYLIRKSPNMRNIKLRSCHTLVSDITIESIAFNLPYLESLELHSLARSVTFPVVSKLVEHCLLLRHLSVVHCDNFTPENVESLLLLTSARSRMASTVSPSTSRLFVL